MGVAANKLFGTATQSEVDECRQLINQYAGVNRDMVHVTNQLVSVINQTRLDLEENRQHIRAIETFLSNLTASLAMDRKQLDSLMVVVWTEMRIEQAFTVKTAFRN